MSQLTPVQVWWSELLLALPEFDLTDVHIDGHDELVAEVELPRGLQPCTRCGLLERHLVHDRRRHTSPSAGRFTCHPGALAQAAAGPCVEGCATFTEHTPSIAPGAVWSRAATRAAVAMAQANVPVDRSASASGPGGTRSCGAVLAAAELVAAVRPTRVGIDETVMTTGRLTTRRRQFLTALVLRTYSTGMRARLHFAIATSISSSSTRR